MSAATFEEFFGFPPQAVVTAPGRVNMLGEHTDYNDGFVLPITLSLATRVEIARSRDHMDRFFARDLDQVVCCLQEGPVPDGFAAYPYGCLSLLREQGFAVPAVVLSIESQVPIGVGLSSSAALEVATLRAARELFGVPIDDLAIAQLAQQAEIRFAGVNCGIMDQMASSLAHPGQMLFIDTRTLEFRLLPLPERSELMVLDSGMARRLGESGYNERRQQCEEAARLLGVKALRDVMDLEALSVLPDLLLHRARHVVSENRRVLEAAQGVDAAGFGRLMNASHQSLRDDFEVSLPELDLLVGLLQGMQEVFGARLTGAGFGGACVALVQEGTAHRVAREVLSGYRRKGFQGALLVPQEHKELSHGQSILT